MLIFYIDECGDSALSLDEAAPDVRLASGLSPYFVLGAVGVRDASRKPLAEALFQL